MAKIQKMKRLEATSSLPSLKKMKHDQVLVTLDDDDRYLGNMLRQQLRSPVIDLISLKRIQLITYWIGDAYEDIFWTDYCSELDIFLGHYCDAYVVVDLNNEKKGIQHEIDDVVASYLYGTKFFYLTSNEVKQLNLTTGETQLVDRHNILHLNWYNKGRNILLPINENRIVVAKRGYGKKDSRGSLEELFLHESKKHIIGLSRVGTERKLTFFNAETLEEDFSQTLLHKFEDGEEDEEEDENIYFLLIQDLLVIGRFCFNIYNGSLVGKVNLFDNYYGTKFRNNIAVSQDDCNETIVVHSISLKHNIEPLQLTANAIHQIERLGGIIPKQAVRDWESSKLNNFLCVSWDPKRWFRLHDDRLHWSQQYIQYLPIPKDTCFAKNDAHFGLMARWEDKIETNLYFEEGHVLINRNGPKLTLEEFLSKLEPIEVFAIGGYLIYVDFKAMLRHTKGMDNTIHKNEQSLENWSNRHVISYEMVENILHRYRNETIENEGKTWRKRDLILASCENAVEFEEYTDMVIVKESLDEDFGSEDEDYY